MALHATLGGMAFPLADTGATTLADLDLGRDILLGLMKAALNYELATRWGDAVAGTPLGADDCLPVETIHPAEPDADLMRQAGFRFPLLCAYRTGEAQFEQLGIEATLLRQSIVLEYILTPWSAGTERKIGDIFRAVAAVAYAVVIDKGHTAYALDETHTTQRKIVLGPGDGCANFYEIKLANVTSGKASFSPDSPAYAACRLTFSVAELCTDTSESVAVPYLGMSFTHDLGTSTSHIDAFVEARTDFPDPDA